MRRLLSLFVFLMMATAAAAQHNHGNGNSAPRPADLHPDLGTYHHTITTRNAEAQKFFDQGLTLLYGFNHDEAARLFRRASELDPDAAMPYWGLALATGPNYNDTDVSAERAQATYDAVKHAMERAPRATQREQDYIRALAKRYPSANPKSDWHAQHLDYSNAMREVVKKYPDDLDAATMFAESLMMLRPWQLWSLDGKPAPGTLELVAVLESVLKRNPNHPGANHFYIHAVEASPNLERAIPSAERLTKLVPGAGHLVHMPGHIWLQTGDYDKAADTNVNAVGADKGFIERTGAGPGIYSLMYYTHNMHFVAYARSQQGRYDEALAAANDMVHNVGAGVDQMQMLEGFITYPLSVQIRFGKWDEILKAAAPNPNWKVATAFHHYARAVAHAARGNQAQSQAEQLAFAAALADVPAEAKYLINNRGKNFLEVAGKTLQARRLWASGDNEKSVAAWREAVTLQDNLAYDEPPAWFYPIRQSLGGALLRSGKAVEAEAVFRQALDKMPRDGRLLFGLWQSLKAQGRDSEAGLVEQQFREAWKTATSPLTVDDL